MPHVRMKLRHSSPQTWLEEISEERPDEIFRILSGHRRDGDLIGVVEVESSDPASIRESLFDSPLTRSISVIYEDDSSLLVQYLGTEPPMYRIVRENGILPRYPLTMRDGWLSTPMFVSQQQLTAYRDALDERGIEYRVDSVAPSLESTAFLTDTQKDAVATAIARGYYDTPRNCTLTELADQLGITKSAASRLLHRAESKIIKSVFAENGF